MILKHWVDTDCIASEEEIAAIIKNVYQIYLLQYNEKTIKTDNTLFEFINIFTETTIIDIKRV